MQSMEGESSARSSSRKESQERATPLLSESTRRRWLDPDLRERPEERNNAVLSTLQLVNTMIGSGILSFAYVFSLTGWAVGSVLLMVFVSLNIVSNLMLLELGAAVGMATGDTSEIIEVAMQSTRMRRVVDVCVALEAFGALLSYTNVMGDLGAVILLRHIPGAYPTVIAVCTVLLAPVCFFRAFGDIAWVSAVSFCFITLTTSIVVAKGALARKAVPAWPTSSVGSVSVLGNYAFAFANQYATHETYASMRPTDRPAIGRAVVASALVGCVLIAAMGLGGLATVGASSNRLASTIIEALNPDLAVTKFLAAITILHLMAYIPNDFIIMRLFLCRFFDVNPLTIPKYRYYLLTFVLLAIPATIMALIPRADVVGAFQLVIALTGSIPIAFGLMFVPIYAFKLVCLDQNKGTDATLFPFLRRHPSLAYGYLVLTALVVIFTPIITVYLFVHDCLTSSCSSFGHRLR